MLVKMFGANSKTTLEICNNTKYYQDFSKNMQFTLFKNLSVNDA